MERGLPGAMWAKKGQNKNLQILYYNVNIKERRFGGLRLLEHEANNETKKQN